MVKCKICNKELKDMKGLSIHLTKKHKMDKLSLKLYYDNYLKKDKNEGKCYFCGNESIFKGISKGYHKICGSKKCLGKTRATGTYEFLMYKYDLSKDDAIELMNKRSKVRGKKIKKSLDKKLKENPNFHKEKSHQTKEYWIKRGYSKEESIKKSNKVMDMIHEKTWNKRKKYPELYKDVNTTQIGYWLKKGYTEEESIEKIKDRQKTFTIEKCIQKYGEEKGLEIWNKRQKEWSKKIEKKYKNGEYVKFRNDNYSELEIELFEKIDSEIESEHIYFGNNQFFRHFKEIGKTFAYDFVLSDKKKIIEFNGDYWHCNPLKYNKNYFHLYLQKFAYEIWERDKLRIDYIENEGYDVKVIWESDYKQNREKVIQECIDFLKN